MMRFAMLASASAMAFVFAIGSVSAADFTTLKGVKAIQMSAGELSAVKGMDHHFGVMTPATTPNTVDNGTNADGLLNPPASSNSAPQTETGTQLLGRFETSFFQDSADGDQHGFFMIGTREVAPSYHGLAKGSCANNVITMPGFIVC
jgi:hypothetical protein